MRPLYVILIALFYAIPLVIVPVTNAQDAPLEAFVLESCPSEVPPAVQVAAGPLALVLLEPLLKPLISSALDEVGAYLASAAAVKSASMSALIEDDFYKLSGEGDLSIIGPRCLVLVSPGSGKPMPSWFAKARERARIQLNSFSTSPRFYFEAKIAADQTPGVSRLTVTPNFLHVGEFLSDGWLYSKVRKYSVVATFRSRLNGEVFGTFKFELDDLSRSTWATTQTISETEKDSSIVPQLSQKLSPSQVPLYPVAGAVSAAVLKQQQVAAPYLEAATLLKKSKNTVPPVRRLADWEIRPNVDPTAATETKKYQAALEDLCRAIDAINRDVKGSKSAISDVRCPVSHIGYMNLTEEARKALDNKLAQDWADEFWEFHKADRPETCAQPGAIATRTCKPPSANPSKVGPYLIEFAVVETREPTEFAKILAATFAANKDKLKTAIEDRTLASRREALEQSAEDSAQKAKIAFDLAKLDVEKATAKLQEAANEPRSTQIALQAEVLKAKVAGNAAAKAAGIGTPYAY